MHSRFVYGVMHIYAPALLKVPSFEGIYLTDRHCKPELLSTFLFLVLSSFHVVVFQIKDSFSMPQKNTDCLSIANTTAGRVFNTPEYFPNPIKQFYIYASIPVLDF